MLELVKGVKMTLLSTLFYFIFLEHDFSIGFN